MVGFISQLTSVSLAGSLPIRLLLNPYFILSSLLILLLLLLRGGTRGSVVGLGTMLQAGIYRVRFPMMSLDFSINLILPTALWS
jgi:hypothetical protein